VNYWFQHIFVNNSNYFYQRSNFYGLIITTVRGPSQAFCGYLCFSAVQSTPTPCGLPHFVVWYTCFCLPLATQAQVSESVLSFFRLRLPRNEHAVPPRCRHPYCSVYYRSNFRHVGHRHVLRPVSKARCPHQNHTVLHQCSNMPKRWQTVT